MKLAEGAMLRVAVAPFDLMKSLSFSSEVSQLLMAIAAADDRCVQSRTALVQEIFDYIRSIRDPKQRAEALEIKRCIFNPHSVPEEILQKDKSALSPQIGAQLSDHIGLLQLKLDLQNQLSQLYQREVIDLRKEMWRICSNDYIQEGVALSSGSLWKSVVRYLNSPQFAAKIDKSQRQFENAMASHLSRLCTKTTPRSILTAVSFIPIDSDFAGAWKNSPDRGRARILKTRFLLKFPMVRKIIDRIMQFPHAWLYVIPRLNPTLKRKDAHHWIFYKMDTAELAAGTEWILYQLNHSVILSEVVRLALTRKYKAGELLTKIKKKFRNFHPNKIEQYYRQLCDIGALNGRLEIPFTELDGLAFLISWLRELPQEHAQEELLMDLQILTAELRQLDEHDW